jgi:hypothetical protein
MFDFALAGLVVCGYPDFIGLHLFIGLHPMLMYYALSGLCVLWGIDFNVLSLILIL